MDEAPEDAHVATIAPANGAALDSTGREVRKPRADERLLAASAHLVLLLSVPGLVVAIVIWIVTHKRSAYVSLQARQAVIWQILSNILLLVLVTLLLGAAIHEFGGAVTAKGASGQADMVKLLGSLVGLYVVLLVALICFWVSAILGAISALLGRSFHYPFMGRKRRG